MSHAVRLSDLSAMSGKDREGVFKRLNDEASQKPNGPLDAATARVKAFEQRYEFSSERLLERLAKGEQKETAEVNEWLFCLRLLSLGKE